MKTKWRKIYSIISSEYSDVRFEQCSVVEFLTAKGAILIEIYFQMQVIYDYDYVDKSIVCPWPTNVQMVNQ